jgi:integrase
MARREIERLTADIAAAAEATGSAYMLPDGNGLYLRVSEVGAKSWILRYRLGTQRRSMGLGAFPLFSPAEARKRANPHRLLLADKRDPLQVKREQRAQTIAEAVSSVTFADVAEHVIRSRRQNWKDDRQEHQWRQSLRDYVFPYVGAVADVDVHVVEKILSPIWAKKPETATRVRARIEEVLDYATVKGWRTGDNPAQYKGRIEHLMPKAKKGGDKQHHEALPYAELPAFMAQLRAVRRTPRAVALELAILTAARSEEARGATWAEFDFKARTWTIPGSRMKGGKEHKVPLSDSALTLLKAMPRKGSQLFKIGGRGMYQCVSALRPGVTVHGFRSTFSTWAQEQTDFASDIVEHCLAHITGDGSEKAYKRGDALDKRRAIMDAWANFCEGIEVVQLQRA